MLPYEREKQLKKIKSFILEYPEHIPEILDAVNQSLKDYKNFCERQNNWKLREALGDAVHLLGMKKKPSEKEMPKFLHRIKNAIFKNGIGSNHHQGEKNFYKRYFGEKE